MSIRDTNVVIIETGRTVVRAGLGLHDLLKTPTVEIQARVGLRQTASENGISNTNGVSEEPPLASTSRVGTSRPTASVTDYLVGTQLDEALANGQDIIVSWPFADGDVSDWTQAEAIWKYIIFNQLQRRRVQNESPVLLSIFPGLSRDTYERICQIFFERFNVAGFGILELPMAQLYAVNTLSGVVVDIGDEKTDITPVYEGFIIHSARTSTPLGLHDCQNYLAHLLRSNQNVLKALSPPGNPTDPETLHYTLLELVKQLYKDGFVKVPSDGETAAPEDEGVTDIAAVIVAGREKAVIESGMKKKATAKQSAAEQARAREIEALDLITVQFREHSLTLGKERHRFCEPLYDPSLLDNLPYSTPRNPKSAKPLPLQETVGHAVSHVGVGQRQYVWQGLLVTGDVTRHVKGIGVALQSRLAPFIGSPELQSDVQPRSIRVVTIPDYYAEYRETGNGFAAFLGLSIIAKIIFSDSNGKNFVSKADYAAKGPHSIIEMTPSLL
ncbi:actin-related protein [Laccaria bicolor S238N-H82]|uniref:Actin-related protein n=1 Tax=Laccaria bicolor (strain S238N-H82 / ATCC MYA-4686) TaxID=486041 RepID=B0DID1_LACBS|nr:actin-related protein [Laccaria bicolor S238N-H82]EDR05669.1 actin-related protein [Laccaria bicolor S238N-H82]|eukprot:XP_001883773.1 actin-related protein [Laccaria bicolor S238N-H82]